MNMEKFILKSKTLQGIVIMLLPPLARLLEFEWAAEDTSMVADLFNNGLTFIGAVWAAIGRFTVKTDLKVL